MNWESLTKEELIDAIKNKHEILLDSNMIRQKLETRISKLENSLHMCKGYCGPVDTIIADVLNRRKK